MRKPELNRWLTFAGFMAFCVLVAAGGVWAAAPTSPGAGWVWVRGLWVGGGPGDTDGGAAITNEGDVWAEDLNAAGDLTVTGATDFNGPGNAFEFLTVSNGFTVTNPTRKPIVLTAAGSLAPSSGGATDPTVNADGWAECAFDAASDEARLWNLVLPSDYGDGTLTVRFYWRAGTDWADSGDSVVWAVRGVALGNSDAQSTALGTAQSVTDTWASGEGTGDVLIATTATELTLGNSPAAGDLIQVEAYRDADNASDTKTGDAHLVAVRLEYLPEDY